VDRIEEAKTILDDIESVLRVGRGMARVIIGDAGFGKTTLLRYIRERIFEKREDALFSYVELRSMSDVKPSQLGQHLYANIIENLEDREGRSGKELLTHISNVLFEKFATTFEKLEFRITKKIGRKLKDRFRKISGYKPTLLALSLLIVDDLNPTLYDYITLARGLEPDEAKEISTKLGERIIWKIPEGNISDSLIAIISAAKYAGYNITIIAIDELEMLTGWHKNWIARFLPKLTALLMTCSTTPCYMLVASTPEFWGRLSEREGEGLYPFLFQRLNPNRIGPLTALEPRDVLALASRIYKMYEKVYGATALHGIDLDALVKEIYSSSRGHPRDTVQQIINKLDEKIIA